MSNFKNVSELVYNMTENLGLNFTDEEKNELVKMINFLKSMNEEECLARDIFEMSKGQCLEAALALDEDNNQDVLFIRKPCFIYAIKFAVPQNKKQNLVYSIDVLNKRVKPIIQIDMIKKEDY